MLRWDSTSPESWANRFGMVAVPAFEPTRAQKYPGKHSVVLDGHSGSFFFSCGSASQLMERSASPSWSWSCNVNHSLIVDPLKQKLYVFKWDNPSEVSTEPLPDEGRAEAIVCSIENDKPPDGPTSIKLALDLFRTVRHEVSAFGGEDLDAVIIFNALLTLSAVGDINVEASAYDVINQLNASNLIVHRSSQLSAKVKKFPITEFSELIRQSDSHGYLLDTDLLVRHASGTLFQEAHIELSGHPARKLFPTAPLDLPRPSGKTKSDVHFTPPSLARFLVQESISEFQRINPRRKDKQLDILDPACGSGVFLIETMRETNDSDLELMLRGVDSSSIACELASFGVHRAIQQSDKRQIAEFKISTADSLLQSTWGSADIVLMNPPFLPWRSLDSDTQSIVKNALGDMYVGQSDTAFAFVYKAIEEMKPGSVLATVVPASFFVSRASRRIRERISSDPEFCVRVLGRFRGYGYFREASVEPGFLVLSRLTTDSQRSTSVIVALAESGYEDKAIREARRLNGNAAINGDAWDVSIKSDDFLHERDWTPRPERARRTLELLSKTTPFVTDLFDIRLGVRPGLKEIFLISADEYENISSERERSLFKPTADQIQDCEVKQSTYIFYPYHGSQLLLGTEDEVSQAAPWFYESRLLPNRNNLENRSSARKRNWWELVEPRLSWMGDQCIVSPQFARSGMFALDLNGKYTVVQGNGWVWKGGKPWDEQTGWAYLALLNSAEFEAILDYFCRRIPGPRFEVSNKYLSAVPIPDLTSAPERLLSNLSQLGRGLREARGISPINQGIAVASAYGIKFDEFRLAFPLLEDKRLEENFLVLASDWKKQTAHHSSMRKRTKHPSFEKIMAMQEEAIPLILRELRHRPQLWFHALESLTGKDPVPDELRTDPKAAAEVWLQWGRNEGFKV